MQRNVNHRKETTHRRFNLKRNNERHTTTNIQTDPDRSNRYVLGLTDYSRSDWVHNKGVYMKVSDHFILQEFVPKEIFDLYGSKAIWFVDKRLIDGMEWLRTYFNASITINNWHKGGTLQNRGFRPPSATVGAKMSQHRYGRAVDFNMAGATTQQTYNIIMDSWGTIRKHIAFTTIEDIQFTPTWIHLDCRHTGSDQLLIVKP